MCVNTEVKLLKYNIFLYYKLRIMYLAFLHTFGAVSSDSVRMVCNNKHTEWYENSKRYHQIINILLVCSYV